MKMTLIRKVFGYLMKKLACEKDIEIVVTHETRSDYLGEELEKFL